VSIFLRYIQKNCSIYIFGWRVKTHIDMAVEAPPHEKYATCNETCVYDEMAVLIQLVDSDMYVQK